MLRDIQGRPVIGSKGKVLGEVTRVLFHPEEPRVVGLEVRPTPWLFVVEKPLRYVPLGLLARWTAQSVVIDAPRLPGRHFGEREIGRRWDDTVVWRGMPVRSRSGADLGRVADAGFAKASGALTRLMLTGGTVSDVAFGSREVEASAVAGFDGDAVVVDDAVAVVAPEGGAVRAAGAAAGQIGDVLRPAAGTVAVKAASAGLAAVKMAGRSRAGKAAGRAWRQARGALKEALGPGEEDDRGGGR